MIRFFGGYIGMMKKKMETTIMGLYRFRENPENPIPLK